MIDKYLLLLFLKQVWGFDLHAVNFEENEVSTSRE